MTQDEHINLAKVPPPEDSEPTPAQVEEAGKKHLEETKNELYDAIGAAGTLTKTIHRLMTEIMTELLTRQQAKTLEYFQKTDRKLGELRYEVGRRVDNERERADGRIDNAYKEIDALSEFVHNMQEQGTLGSMKQLEELAHALDELKERIAAAFDQVSNNTQRISTIEGHLGLNDATTDDS